MSLTRPVKIFIGLTTAWVVLYPFLFIVLWLVWVLGIGGIAAAGPALEPAESPFPTMMAFFFFGFFPLHCLTMLAQFGLTVFYIIHMSKTNLTGKAFPVVLGIGTFFLPYLAMPVYYYAYIWSDPPPAWALQ